MLNMFGQLFLPRAMLNEYSQAVDHSMSSTESLAIAVTSMYMCKKSFLQLQHNIYKQTINYR